MEKRRSVRRKRRILGKLDRCGGRKRVSWELDAIEEEEKEREPRKPYGVGAMRVGTAVLTSNFVVSV